MRYLTLFFALICISIDGASQAKIRKLSSSINHPSLNLYAPFISADANAMVFISDDAEDAVLTPFFTLREAMDWRKPQMLPKNIYTRLNFLRGYALSADGKRIFVSTMKSPGVGGYDIWYADWKGTAWSDPVNFGMPINTKGNEACPSISTDGNTIYFMRCDKMDANTADNCKIYRATKKSNGQWEEPVELPSHINTGNSQTPRIMADGETLIFSSNKIAGNKGGMDLYATKFQNGSWTSPQPIAFTNTEKDDQYVSVSALGRYLLRDSPGARKNELVEYLIPDDIRPRGMMKLEGRVVGINDAPVASYLSAIDMNTGKRFYNGRPAADGSFLLYLKEGTKYEIPFEPEQSNMTYFSKVFDLTSDKIPQSEKITVTLKPVSAGDEILLSSVRFKPSSTEIDLQSSINELKRASRLIGANPTRKFEVQVLLTGYIEDSIKSIPDLTEVIYDSITTQVEEIDSLGQLYTKDSVVAKTIYHNNRTIQQAQNIVQYLKSNGSANSQITYFGNAIPATLPEERKTTIKIVVK